MGGRAFYLSEGVRELSYACEKFLNTILRCEWYSNTVDSVVRTRDRKRYDKYIVLGRLGRVV